VGDFASSVATGLNNRLFVATASNTWFNSVVKQIDAASGLSRGPNVLNGGSVYSGALQISPDGTSLYYATYGLSPGDLYKFNVAGTTPVLLYHNSQDIGENGEQVVLSPDGSMVAYVCGYGYNGYQIPNFSAGSMSVKGVFATGAYPDALAYSPDGKFAYALHSVYPTAVDVYNTSSYALVGQFPAMDRGFDMMVDHTGQHLFASYTSTYFGQNNLVAYATAYSVPEPSTLVILASGIVFISKRGKVLKRR
jgi:hypothetical protein